MRENYKPEEVQTIDTGERRVRDVTPAPKRREGERPEVKVQKADYVSDRELHLLHLIDEHITRLREEREFRVALEL